MDSWFDPCVEKGGSLSGRLRTLCALVALQLAGIGPAEALQAELTRYYDSVKHVCTTGVTPEMTAAYEVARQALERARQAGALAGNFAGVKAPPEAWLDCLQAPGDGKT
jgi:hypothetical protein